MKLTEKHRERFVRVESRQKGKAVGFRCDVIRLPNGKTATREYMTHPGAVGVLAFPKPNHILLVKQYRYPMSEFTLEIPAGKIDPKENPDHCIERELEEETGYRAKKIKRLVAFCPTAAFSNEVIYLYEATGLTAGEAHPDEDEFLEVVIASTKQMDTWIRQGKIRDSKTLIAYLMWKASKH